MRNQIRRILSEVARGSAEWTSRHKKAIGGVGAAGAAGAIGAEPGIELARKGIGFGRRVIGLGEAVEKAEGPEEPKSPAMYGYMFPEPGCYAGEMRREITGVKK